MIAATKAGATTSNLTQGCLEPIWSQSYDFRIYNYNASFVVGSSVFSKKKKKNIFVFKTH
jgi:hypothetical protein